MDKQIEQKMMDNPFAKEPKASSGWLWQVFTGVGLVFLLGLHFIANHFIAKGGLRDFADVVSYLRNPIILVLEVLFLIVVTVHAMLGVRAIATDFGLSDRAGWQQFSGSLVADASRRGSLRYKRPNGRTKRFHSSRMTSNHRLTIPRRRSCSGSDFLIRRAGRPRRGEFNDTR